MNQIQVGQVESVHGSQPQVASRLSAVRFGELFESHSRKLWCVAAAVMGDRARAVDVVQDAALIALGKLNEFDPASSFGAWMSQIVRYVALNEGRKKRRDMPTLTDPSIMDSAQGRSLIERSASVDAQGRVSGFQHEFDDAVCGALESLEETPRTCLLMKTVLELPYVEIAELLGIPEGTAMSHVHRARKAMREHLAAHGFDAKGERS